MWRESVSGPSMPITPACRASCVLPRVRPRLRARASNRRAGGAGGPESRGRGCGRTGVCQFDNILYIYYIIYIYILYVDSTIAMPNAERHAHMIQCTMHNAVHGT